jgi:hypothetical protein
VRTRVFEVIRAIKSRELRIALFAAMAADALQIIALPFFAPGAFSPADTAIDVAAALILSGLLGWHWAFLPTIIAEVIPAFDLFPTWTAAVLYVSWQRRQSPGTEHERLRMQARAERERESAKPQEQGAATK